MRFKRSHGRSTPPSDTTHHNGGVPRVAPPHDLTGWRSLWSRLYERWTQTPTTHTSPPVSVRSISCRPRNASRCHGFCSREHGEVWFVTRRRHDTDQTKDAICGGPPADEVEVPPPPRAVPPSKNHRLYSNCDHSPHMNYQVTLSQKSDDRDATDSEWHNSEIEIAMASYSSCSSPSSVLASLSSFSDSSNSSNDASDSDDPQDPFLQRYSSWYSVDDETCHPYDPEEDHYQQNETEYEVRYVDMGRGILVPVRGIWV